MYYAAVDHGGVAKVCRVECPDQQSEERTLLSRRREVPCRQERQTSHPIRLDRQVRRRPQSETVETSAVRLVQQVELGFRFEGVLSDEYGIRSNHTHRSQRRQSCHLFED